MSSPLYDIPIHRIDGTTSSLDPFAGQVLLIVNVASKCGLTPQYDGLEKLYERYRSRGFAVLGFPSNQFAGQEPGTDDEIAEFCRLNYGVTFPMFAKIDVNGADRHPLYKELIAAAPARRHNALSHAKGRAKNVSPDIRWNFEKFLVGRTGNVITRFDPDVVPEDALVVGAIEDAL